MPNNPSLRNTESVQRAEAAAVMLRDAVAAPVLRALTNSLGWGIPSSLTNREGQTCEQAAKGVHKYPNGLATLTIRATSEGKPSVDLRVTCEFGDGELFNAERIVSVEDVAEPSVREWIEKQLSGCTAALKRRTS